MQNKHGDSIQSHDCYLKRCVKKNSLTCYSFYLIESRISSNCTRNIHKPSRLKKRSTEKKNTVRKTAKRRQIRKSTLAEISILANFYSITKCFAITKIGILRVKFIASPSVKFPKIRWTVKHICPS